MLLRSLLRRFYFPNPELRFVYVLYSHLELHHVRVEPVER